jgi:hypothetical protein
MKTKILTAILLFVFALISLSGLVLAQGPTLSGGGGPTLSGGGGGPINLPNPLTCVSGSGEPQILCVAGRVIKGIFILANPIAVIMILIGAFQLLASGGSPERVTKGRKTILYAVVGYAIVLLAQGLVLIIKEILGG